MSRREKVTEQSKFVTCPRVVYALDASRSHAAWIMPVPAHHMAFDPLQLGRIKRESEFCIGEKCAGFSDKTHEASSTYQSSVLRRVARRAVAGPVV